jgi:hypothetical protein
MTQRITAMSPARRAAIRARRGRERGAAVFVVVLLISMLLGIGLFAARSASLATAASGHARQMTQSQYLAEYGILLSRAELDDTQAVQVWRDLALKPGAACYGQAQMSNPHCAVYCSQRAQAKLAAGSQNMLEAWSLGSDKTEGIFCVQLTDWKRSDIPQPGTDGSLKPYAVTATSIAVVRNQNAQDTVGWSTSTQMSRAYLTTVPIAGK